MRRNRGRKWDRFMALCRPSEETLVLDVGYSASEYSPYDNYIEKRYPYPERLTALGIDDPSEFRRQYPSVTAVQYDGGQFPFKDNQFDLCWSNAVLEHVGDRASQIRFLAETRRVARMAFLTTPNRRFPIEVHTRTPLLHYLPTRLFEGYLRRVGKGWATGDYMRLLSRRELERQLAAAGFTRYRILENRLAGLALDFAVIAECS
jgi:hypothetical protein